MTHPIEDRLDAILEDYYENAFTETETTAQLTGSLNEAKQALLTLMREIVAEGKPEERELIEPVTKRIVTHGDKVGIDLEADTRGSLKFIQDNGYNQALRDYERRLREMIGGENE